jgi:hypothetical protein
MAKAPVAKEIVKLAVDGETWYSSEKTLINGWGQYKTAKVTRLPSNIQNKAFQ